MLRFSSFYDAAKKVGMSLPFSCCEWLGFITGLVASVQLSSLKGSVMLRIWSMLPIY